MKTTGKVLRVKIPSRDWEATRADDTHFILRHLSAPVTVSEDFVKNEAQRALETGRLVTVDYMHGTMGDDERLPDDGADVLAQKIEDYANTQPLDLLGAHKIQRDLLEMIGKPMKTRRRQKAPEGQCKSCDEERARGNKFHPSHDPSPNCESGKHPHCTCDVCF